MVTRDSLSAADARRLALRAQGLLGSTIRPRTPSAALRKLAELQLDTISVLARSHELVCYSRLGPVGRPAVEAACWGVGQHGAPLAVEYWAHAACILPIESWPWFAFRRRRYRARPNAYWSRLATDEVMADVRLRLAADGPLTATEMGGAKGGGPWWDWSPLKLAVERLLAFGDVVCVTRRGWRRVYDLPERAIPAAFQHEPDDETCLRQLIKTAAACLGVATVSELADYFRLRIDDVKSHVAACGLVPVAVQGWSDPAWADPDGLAELPIRGRHRTTLLSPFDSLIWHRPRTARLFGFHHRLEAYTPAPKRVHGYFTMPVLAGGRLIGRVDPKRSGSTLVARQISLVAPPGPAEPGLVAAVAAALREAALWVGCSSVAVEQTTPAALGPSLARALGD
jgi:uncharacterized protein